MDCDHRSGTAPGDISGCSRSDAHLSPCLQYKYLYAYPKPNPVPFVPRSKALPLLRTNAKNVKFFTSKMWKISRKSATASESPTPPTRAVFSSLRGFFDPDPCIHMVESCGERVTPRGAPNRCIPAWRVVWSDQSSPAAQ